MASPARPASGSTPDLAIFPYAGETAAESTMAGSTPPPTSLSPRRWSAPSLSPTFAAHLLPLHVGNTTTTANLAASLARLGLPVVAVGAGLGEEPMLVMVQWTMQIEEANTAKKLEKAPYAAKAEKLKAEYAKKIDAYNNPQEREASGDSDKSKSEVNDEDDGSEGDE